MAINARDPNHRAKLSQAVFYHFTHASPVRERRRTLYDLFEGAPSSNPLLSGITTKGPLVNLVQAFVLGQIVAMAWRGPRWSVNARTMMGRGFDKRIQNFLTRYSEILELPRIFRQAAIDSAFGWSAVKIINSVAPKGVYSPYAPRAYRIAPDALIVDGTASSFDECAFMADTYLVPLDEARAWFRDGGQRLQPWGGSAMSPIPGQDGNTDAFAQEYTRLIDVYLPSTGTIATWPAMTDRFSEITEEPLSVIDTPINPYEILSLLDSPNVLKEMARLDALKELHLLHNDMLHKAANQARNQRRNPIGEIGSETDVNGIFTKPDGEPTFVEDLKKVGLYTLPGADPGIVNMAQLSAALFSQYGGNLEVALGQSAGAGTARQTQALIQQINARQSVDREAYERFVSNVGKKLATLAFTNDVLELEYRERVPGTQITYNAGWAPASRLPRPGMVDDFSFEVVPFSTMLRTPQDRVKDLMEVTGQILQVMQVAASGAPLNLEAIMQSYSEAYDNVPQLAEWWSGEQPDPATRASTSSGQYIAQAGPNGSEVKHTYESDAGSGGEFLAQVPGNTPGEGGLTIPQVGGV